MTVSIIQGDTRERLAQMPADTFDCCVTSPPYWGLRDYGVDGQIGLEPTLTEYLSEMVGVCREVRRVLKPTGTFWLNIGDSYAGSWGARGRSVTTNAPRPDFEKKHGTAAPARNGCPDLAVKPKDLCMVPNRLAILLQEDGWYVRSEIIWHKPNPMPESVTDRPTSSHEKVWLLTKSERYFYDHLAVLEKAVVPTWEDGSRVFGGVNKHGANAQHGERTTGRVTSARKALRSATEERHRSSIPGGQSLQTAPTGMRNLRNVWSITTKPFKGAHFATMAPDLAERCVKAGCPADGHVLDPFFGAGTTGLVADRLGRHCTGIELNPEYIAIAQKRLGIVPEWEGVFA